MWIFTTSGFFSVVATPRGQMMVRARVESHLKRLKRRFRLKKPILRTQLADYRYRIIISRRDWARVISTLAKEVRYGNFKDEVARRRLGRAYEQALHDVWLIMYDLQPTTTRKSLWLSGLNYGAIAGGAGVGRTRITVR